MKRGLFEAGAIIGAFAVVATLAVLSWQANDLVLSNGQPVFGDFIAFWSAGRAALDGHVADVHVRDLIASYHQQAAPGVRFVAIWSSPPTFLLVAAALALLPYPAAAIAFLLAGGALYLWAARLILPDRRALIFALTLPAALYHLGSVQTGLLIAGLSGLALYWLDRRPLTSGALVGLLAIKPHLAVLWPLFLALSGRWRAFAAATVSTIVFAGLAGAVFGFDSYARFFAHLETAQSVVSEQLTATPAYASLYASLLQLGTGQAIATALHAASACVAIAAALWIFRHGERARGGAALCAATLIALPYVYFYDFTLLAVGAALLGAPRNRLEITAAVAAWGAGLSLPLSYLLPLPYAPLAAWLLLAVSAQRESAAERPAPAQQR